ncbi:MAG TPA: flavodoxin family protein [Deltaproteobacteria bacterium]|nr:flavodoxin family protein [Deltaproteobacteria bacterium]
MKSLQEEITDLSPQQVILGIGGSPRKGGNTDVLLDHIITGATLMNLETERILLRDCQFQPCIGCERCRKDRICTGLHDDMTPLYNKIVRASGLVLVSPVHNYNVTAWMKAFIDRLYCFYDFTDDRPRGWSSRLADQGRKAVVAAVCEQASRDDLGFTLEAMRRPLEALGYEIVGELAVFGIFDQGKVRDNPEVLSQATRLGSELAEALAR